MKKWLPIAVSFFRFSIQQQNTVQKSPHIIFVFLFISHNHSRGIEKIVLYMYLCWKNIWKCEIKTFNMDTRWKKQKRRWKIKLKEKALFKFECKRLKQIRIVFYTITCTCWKMEKKQTIRWTMNVEEEKSTYIHGIECIYIYMNNKVPFRIIRIKEKACVFFFLSSFTCASAQTPSQNNAKLFWWFFLFFAPHSRCSLPQRVDRKRERNTVK